MKVIKILNKTGSMSQASLNVNINLDKLENLEKELGKKFSTRVGILGDSNSRATISRSASGKAKITKDESLSSMTNAEIGFIHEFGRFGSTPRIPQRSFLRMPLMLFLNDAVRELAPKIKVAIDNGNIKSAYALLGIGAEKVIQDGFATGGYGTWEKLSPITIKKKGSSAILIDSAQLRKSIHSTVIIE